MLQCTAALNTKSVWMDVLVHALSECPPVQCLSYLHQTLGGTDS